MKTKVEIINMTKVKLNDINVGDWFYVNIPHGDLSLMIKGDDTAYEGAKIICTIVDSGVIARVNFDAEIMPIKSVKIKIESELKF